MPDETDQQKIERLESDLATAKRLWNENQSRLETWVRDRDATIRDLRAKLANAEKV